MVKIYRKVKHCSMLAVSQVNCEMHNLESAGANWLYHSKVISQVLIGIDTDACRTWINRLTNRRVLNINISCPTLIFKHNIRIHSDTTLLLLRKPPDIEQYHQSVIWKAATTHKQLPNTYVYTSSPIDLCISSNTWTHLVSPMVSSNISHFMRKHYNTVLYGITCS